MIKDPESTVYLRNGEPDDCLYAELPIVLVLQGFPFIMANATENTYGETAEAYMVRIARARVAQPNRLDQCRMAQNGASQTDMF